MSRLAPRNATVQVLTSDKGLQFAHKRYRAVYTARQEQEAYDKIQPLFENVKDIRPAHILRVDDKENSLCLEYIPGKTLHEMAGAGIFSPLRDWQERLVELFVAARNAGIRFDSDPSNLIIHSETGELVSIDPVCADIGLEDYSAVVFVWGLVKLILRNPKLWQFPSLIRIMRSYLSSYLELANINSVYFNRQMATYIDTVIGWNREMSSDDGLRMIFLRRCIAIPLYSIASCLFRWNLVR